MSNFHPDTSGWMWSLVYVRLFSREGRALQINVTGLCGENSQCSGHTGFAPRSRHVCFPRLHCLGSRLLYREWTLSYVWFQFWGTPQKHSLSWACVLCLPQLSSSGCQELDRRTLPGCSAPCPLCGLRFSFHARQSGAPCFFWGAV